MKQLTYFVPLATISFLIFLFCCVSASNVSLTESNNWSANMTNVAFSSLALGDIDNDGDLDLFLSGAVSEVGIFSKVYINNGTTLIENSTWQENLTLIYAGAVSLNDINKDGRLDLLAIGDNDMTGPEGLTAKIYINNGTTLLENQTWQENLTGTKDISIISGDVNMDGYDDVAIGLANYKFRIYLNNGSTVVENIVWEEKIQEAFSLGLGTGGVGVGSLNFGDYNNDGDLDLMATGHDGGDPRNKLFENNGTTFFIKYSWQNNLIGGSVGGVDHSSTAFGDIDNDGDLDLALNGEWWGYHSRIFINNGTQLIYNYNWSQNIIGVKQGSIAFGDYDNDGDLDLAWCGRIGDVEYITKIYENNGTSFIEDTVASENLTGVSYPSIALGDIDNDGDLDLVLSGYKGIDLYISRIYINNITIPNNLPQPPNSSFAAIYSANSVSFGWGNGSDNETPTAGLYYNLRIGTASNKNAIVTGVYGGSSNPTAGYFGNMMQRKNITIKREWQANTTYFWSVQTIDTGLAAGNWSTEQNFTTGNDVTAPNITLVEPEDGYYSDDDTVVFNASIVDDSGIINVSLWSNFNGTWMINETNSSGLNDTYYFFSRNLSQGSYLWMIQAYDSTSINYDNSSTRILYVDLYAPQVSLISPENGSSWSSSPSVMFNYNVSDFAVVNCSLVIDNSVDQTETSVIVNTTMNFTKTLANGDYNWYVNCTDNVNRVNYSGTYLLTVNYVAPPGDGGGGTGGGGTFAPVENITNVTEIEEPEPEQEQEVKEPEREVEEKEKEGFTEFVEGARVYLIVAGIIVVGAVMYFAYIHDFMNWMGKKRVKWRERRWK